MYFTLQSIVYWRGKHVCVDFDRRVLQIRFGVVDFDRHLSNENPNESIDEMYLCGQKWPNHGTHRETK